MGIYFYPIFNVFSALYVIPIQYHILPLIMIFGAFFGNMVTQPLLYNAIYS